MKTEKIYTAELFFGKRKYINSFLSAISRNVENREPFRIQAPHLSDVVFQQVIF